MFKKSKIIALLLSVLMLISIWAPAFAAAAPSENIPILRIHGDSDIYFIGDDGKKHSLYSDGDYAKAIAKAALPYAMLGDWDTWCEKAWEQLKPAYKHIKPDENGNIPPESWDEDKIPVEEYTYCDTYEVSEAYELFPDMRISPMDEADYIHDVIEKIKSETGHDKIILIGQCLGNAYMMAYLQKYEAQNNYSGIESILISTTSANGLDREDRLFSGTIEFEPESFYRAMHKYNSFGSDLADGVFLELIIDTLEILYRTKNGPKVTVDLVRDVYNKIKDGFLGKMLQEHYARCGGFVAQVLDHYEEYRDYIFPTDEDKEFYAVQLAKFDDYYYNIGSRQKEIIGRIRDAGINVSCLVEYGFQSKYPSAGVAALETTDGRVPVSRGSFGAIGRNIGDPFPEEYVTARAAEGTDQYISPDRMVDALPGLLPESTWYVKNAPHRFDNAIMALATAIVRTKNATVDLLEPQGFTRFMNYVDADTPLTPLKAVEPNDQPVITPKTKTFIGAIFHWYETFFRLIKTLIT